MRRSANRVAFFLHFLIHIRPAPSLALLDQPHGDQHRKCGIDRLAAQTHRLAVLGGGEGIGELFGQKAQIILPLVQHDLVKQPTRDHRLSVRPALAVATALAVLQADLLTLHQHQTHRQPWMHQMLGEPKQLSQGILHPLGAGGAIVRQHLPRDRIQPHPRAFGDNGVQNGHVIFRLVQIIGDLIPQRIKAARLNLGDAILLAHVSNIRSNFHLKAALIVRSIALECNVHLLFLVGTDGLTGRILLLILQHLTNGGELCNAALVDHVAMPAN